MTYYAPGTGPAPGDRIFVAAEFRIGGQSMQLTPPGRIEHNHFALEEATYVPGDFGVATIYRYDGSGYEAFHRWSWTDTGGRTLANEIQLVLTTSTGPPVVISRTTGATVSFEPPVGSGEAVAVIVYGELGDTQAFWARDLGATTVEIDVAGLSRFGPDEELSIGFLREGTYALQEATSAGGQITVSLTTSPFAVASTP